MHACSGSAQRARTHTKQNKQLLQREWCTLRTMSLALISIEMASFIMKPNYCMVNKFRLQN